METKKNKFKKLPVSFEDSRNYNSVQEGRPDSGITPLRSARRELSNDTYFDRLAAKLSEKGSEPVYIGADIHTVRRIEYVSVAKTSDTDIPTLQQHISFINTMLYNVLNYPELELKGVGGAIKVIACI